MIYNIRFIIFDHRFRNFSRLLTISPLESRINMILFKLRFFKLLLSEFQEKLILLELMF